MRSNYKKLGQFIQQVDIRNKDLEVTKLVGVSIRKVIISSIANTVGTNMKGYKIIAQNQFVYGTVTSRNGEKISIALFEENEKALVSQIYTVFEIIDTQKLLPEYLMMWFRRAEFDRYARFRSHGSVREVFDWDEMCEIELPVPSIEKQQEIVDEYKTIINRIKLNEKINNKLEETAQAIYKQWFVDFEFPMTKEYAEAIGKPELEGRPYTSNGGELVYNEELDKEIPIECSDKTLSEYATVKSGFAFKSTWWQSQGLPVIKIGSIQNNTIDIDSLAYVNKSQKDRARNYIAKPGDVVIAMTGATIGKIGIVPDLNTIVFVNQRVGLFDLGESPLNRTSFLYYSLLQQYVIEEIQNVGGDSAQANISGDQIGSIKVVYPNAELLVKFNSLFCEFIKHSILKKKKNDVLKNISRLLMEKMATVADM